MPTHLQIRFPSRAAIIFILSVGITACSSHPIDPTTGRVNLQSLLLQEHGPSVRPAEAFKFLQKEAARGSPNAQSELARRYYLGLGVTPDYAAAAHWFRKAAERGDGLAQVALASLYLEGEGVPRNEAEAYKWLCIAETAHGKPSEYARDIKEAISSSLSSEERMKGEEAAKEWLRHDQ